MLVVEHLVITFIVVTVCYLLFLAAAMIAQMLDLDHKCAGLGVVDNFKLLLRCGSATDQSGFTGDCWCLHRGGFHSVKLFWAELAVVIILVGFVFGHGIHLFLDGYGLLDLAWIK